jgi:hypothetical protein
VEILIRWRLFVNAKTQEKAERVIARTREALGAELSIDTLARDRDDATLFDCHVTTRAPVESDEDAVVKTLRLASRLAHGWDVNGLGTHIEDWGGSASRNLTVPGIAWISFTIARP